MNQREAIRELRREFRRQGKPSVNLTKQPRNVRAGKAALVLLRAMQYMAPRFAMSDNPASNALREAARAFKGEDK